MSDSAKTSADFCRRSYRYQSRELRRLQRRRQERGIILVFVVVLLSLLAIMGTAYLATSRADRQAITSNGRGALPGVTTPRLFQRELLDNLLTGSGSRLQNELAADLFNMQPGRFYYEQGIQGAGAAARNDRMFAAFRQQLETGRSATLGGGSAHFYENYDAPGRADPWLASVLPVRIGGTVAWPWISAPIVGEPRAGSTTFGAAGGRQILPGVDVEPFFADPRNLSTGGYAGTWADQTGASPALTPRDNVGISSVRMLREDATIAQAMNTRIYPGLIVTTPADPAIAGDADGDGIADAGLMPVVLNPGATGLNRYLDTTNNVVYFVSYRIVDNSALLNIATALSAQGDFATNTTFAIRTGLAEEMSATNADLRNALAMESQEGVNYADSPNLGFFRSNVGAVELFREAMRPFDPTTPAPSPPTPTDRPSWREVFRLVDARMPLGRLSPQGATELSIQNIALPDDPNLPNDTAPSWPVRTEGTRNGALAAAPDDVFKYRSLGDLLEQQVAFRVRSPGNVEWWTAPGTVGVRSTGFVGLPTSDAVSLAVKGGTLYDSSITPTGGEADLAFSLRMAAPNYSTSGEPAWRWFPANEIDIWYDWTKSFNADLTGGSAAPTYGNIGIFDFPPNADERVFQFDAATHPGMASVRLPKSIRSLITTYNGITANAPERRDEALTTASKLPAGMPAYGSNLSANEYPASRVSAATGTKEQLWRAFWSAMTQQLNQASTVVDRKGDSLTYVTYDAFSPPDRHPSAVQNTTTPVLERLDDNQMALIRSAVAACNTIDLRDDDQDVTAMTVDLGAITPGTDRMFARVYGTEKQLLITSVVIDDDDTATTGSIAPSVYVEVYNPSDEAIDLSAYRIGVVERTMTPPTTLATPDCVTIPDEETQLMPVAPAGSPLLQPGGFVIISNHSLDAGSPQPIGIIVQPENTSPPTPQPDQPQAPQVIHNDTASQLVTVQNLTGPQDREIVLMRTRRADGAPSTEDPGLTATGKPAFSEGPVGAGDIASLMTLVPIDAVDLRTLSFPNIDNAGSRYCYVRTTGEHQLRQSTANAFAWKNFYAGKFFERRPVNGSGMAVPPNPSLPPKDSGGTVTNWAWREYPTPGGAGPFIPLDRTAPMILGTPHLDAPELQQTPSSTGSPVLPPAPFFSPTIQIQNFKPYVDLTGTPGPEQHPANRFPYGSPFARNGDLLAVPFIGSYKIYRTNAALSTPPELYEYVPLTMDVGAVAPTPDIANSTIGRFDTSKAAIDPALPPNPLDATTNEWAEDLFDYVTARQTPAQTFLPDVPQAVIQPAGGPGVYNDPTQPLTDQDGPIVGFDKTPRTLSGASDPATHVPWVAWTPVSNTPNTPGAATSSRRAGDLITLSGTAGGAGTTPSDATLIAGIMNLNTAPAVVRRMLPMIVNSAGRVDFDRATDSQEFRDQRRRAALIDGYVDDLQLRDATNAPFGITSIGIYRGIPDTQAAPVAVLGSDEMMAVGDLQPFYRPSATVDFIALNRDMTRISNLVSQRSDVFTVYVTVQAWTWMGARQPDDQAKNTRMVGEVRKSFIVDRSRITGRSFGSSNLVVIPVDQQ